MNLTTSNRVDKQNASLKIGKNNENKFSAVQMSQNNDLNNGNKGNL